MRSHHLRRPLECFALGFVTVMLAQAAHVTAETRFVSTIDDGGGFSENAAVKPAPIPTAIGGLAAPVQKTVEPELPQTGFTRYARKSIRVNGDREPRNMTVLALSKQHPDFSIIECVANCIGPVGAVVYFKPRVATTIMPLAGGGMIQTAAVGAASELEPSAVVCLAGCYDKTPQPSAAPLPVGSASLEAAVVVSSVDMTPTLSVPTTRPRFSIGGLRRVKSRVGHARVRHQWPAERASVVTSYTKFYRPSYRAY